ncbi:MAG: zinc-binding dehydrogenase [Rhodopseudomonas sp.]|nr:zinc-binding dehydrogenase [Rhodopseudomonas sp.]
MLPTTQSAIVIAAAGGPEVLTEQDRWPVPVPGADDVLIEVMAAGVNRHDCNQRKAGPRHEPNPVPGLEAAGRIVACGANVPRHRLGERVIALTDGGSYAHYVIAPAELAMPMPDGLTWLAGAALPEALFTAWFNFHALMRLAPGENALIHGGASGVGTIAIQMLSALGHTVYATAGTPEKRRAAADLGCAATFDYNDPDLAEKVKAATDGRGIDTLLDTSAGAHLEADLAMLAMGGRIAHLSAGGGKTLAVPLRSVMARRASITGAFLRSTPLAIKKKLASELREQIWPLLGRRIMPRIEATYPLAAAADAHRQMERNSHIGKIMLAVGCEGPSASPY